MSLLRFQLPSCFAILFVCLSTSAAFAQDSIITDRPDAAESSRTVGAGHFQIETGFDATFAGDTTVYVFPTKLRVGVIEQAELHLESDVFGVSRTDTPLGTVEADGVTPLDVGGKFHIWEGESGSPSLGVLAALSVPLDDAQVWGLTALFAADFDITDIIGLGTNVGVSVPFEDAGVITGLYAVALGIGLPPVPDLGLFIEVFGGVNEDAFSMLLDGGLTYLITPTLQLDAYARTGLVNDETDIGFGGGVSAKF